MTERELLSLLARARGVLERYLFDGDAGPVRDDIAELCMAIDDVLPDESAVSLKCARLERSAA